MWITSGDYSPLRVCLLPREVSMRLLTAALALTALTTMSAASQRPPSTAGSLERPFAAHGRVEMDLAAGEYRISPTRDPLIRMRWTVADPSRLRQVVATASVRGSNATISTDAPHNSSFKVTIEVPERSDLYVRLTAGELKIGDIEGNKDISLHAGELDIDVGNPATYRRVEASVWAGEVHASPYGLSKEGLFRSIDWKGHGSYRLAAHVKAGEVHLHSQKGESENR